MLSEYQIEKISEEVLAAITGITTLEAVAILEVIKIALIQTERTS